MLRIIGFILLVLMSLAALFGERGLYYILIGAMWLVAAVVALGLLAAVYYGISGWLRGDLDIWGRPTNPRPGPVEKYFHGESLKYRFFVGSEEHGGYSSRPEAEAAADQIDRQLTLQI